MPTDIVVMTEICISNVEQILRRRVANDGRCGGLQKFVGKEVDVVVYENVETEPDFAERNL